MTLVVDIMKDMKDASSSQELVDFVKANKQLFVDAVCQNAQPSDNPIAVFMAGTPGAGKTEVAKSIMEFFETAPCRIDADDFRPLIPGYTGTNSDIVQPAASLAVDKVLDVVLAKKYSFILDGTFAINKSIMNIKRALRKGFEVHIYFIYQAPVEAWEFTKIRELAEGRSVPITVFVDAYYNSRANVSEVKAEFGNDVLLQVITKSYNENKETVYSDVQDLDKVLPKLYNKDELIRKLNG